MKCPKCGYHSFDHLDSCKKCSIDLTEHKDKFKLRGFFCPEQGQTHTPASLNDEADSDETGAAGDFGFDFLDDGEPASDQGDNSPAASTGNQTHKPADPAGISLDDDTEFSLDQPFGVDGENVPADPSRSDSDAKPGKGQNFTF